MAQVPDNDITRLLLAWSGGDEAALGNLLPLVYEELRRIAEMHLSRERSAHTLQRTALVHEAFLRLVDQRSVTWQSRVQFFGLASRMMRRILVDYARRRGAAKRPSERVHLDLDDLPAETQSDLDFEKFDRLLARLGAAEPRSEQLVELRFFGGLSVEEAASVLGISVATVKRDWVVARAWLQREMESA